MTRNKLSISICITALLSCRTYANTTLLRSVEKISPSELDESMLSPSDQNNRNLRHPEKENRPVIHTFYQRSPKTGMDDDADDRLIDTWKHAWHDAGWEPRVLSLRDAITHPEYEHIDKIFDPDRMPFGIYDKMCFMRWLTMAAVGGGWMSDYDTFPLTQSPFSGDGDQLPHEGRFTLYDKVGLAGGVPSLASGSKAEYERILMLLIDNLLTHGIKEKSWTDMYAFIDIANRDREAYVVDKHVLKGRTAFSFWKRTQTLSRCEGVKGDEWAVHFSHTAVNAAGRNGELGELQGGVRHRAEIANNFLKQWKLCGYGI